MPDIEGRGLLSKLPAPEIAELRLEAERVAMRPKARIALPVFFRSIIKQAKCLSVLIIAVIAKSRQQTKVFKGKREKA